LENEDPKVRIAAELVAMEQRQKAMQAKLAQMEKRQTLLIFALVLAVLLIVVRMFR
jgi:hypothetical protein